MLSQVECPYCNQKTKFVDVSETIQNILKLFPKPKASDISRFCKICHEFGIKNHVCLNKDLCFKHSRERPLIETDRVVDQKLAKFFSCDLCKEFLTKPC